MVRLPRPPPPYDIESLQRIEALWRAIKEWIDAAPLWPCSQQDPPPGLVSIMRRKFDEGITDQEPDLDWFNQARNPGHTDQNDFDQSPAWRP